MFTKGKKLKVSEGLYARLEKIAVLQGCASADEYVQRVLENEVDRVLAQEDAPEMSAQEVENIAAKLKGLGYLE